MDDATATPADRFLRSDALVVKRHWTNKWLWLLAVMALAAVGAWWMTHPAGFPERGTFSEQTPTGSPLFIGVLGPSSDSGRSLVINDTHVPVEGPDGTEAALLICRGGSIGTTADANAFCPELVEAKGQTFHYGETTAEQLVLRVSSPTPGTVDIAGVDITFREGIQFGTLRVGPHLVLTVLDR